MAVQPHRTSWTDERLDDLNQSIRDGFARNDRDHRGFFEEMRAMRDQSARQFDEITRRMDAINYRLDERIDGLQRSMVIGMFGISGTIFAAVIAALIKVG